MHECDAKRSGMGGVTESHRIASPILDTGVRRESRHATPMKCAVRLLALSALLSVPLLASPVERLRVVIETDAGGDPDDEQSLVRFLLYAGEWDVEGIIAARPAARDGENKNLERTAVTAARPTRSPCPRVDARP